VVTEDATLEVVMGAEVIDFVVRDGDDFAFVVAGDTGLLLPAIATP